MPSIARVITTFECGRACVYCCNKYETLISKAIEIHDIGQASGYDQVLLTGGEPMLYPAKIIGYCMRLRECGFKGKIYMYSAKFVPAMWDVIPHLDGIHFTLHTASWQDRNEFNMLQVLVGSNQDKSFRLYISPSITQAITIYPNLWKRVEVKPWIPEGQCPLPEGETLFSLKEK
jgi:organic radical activating enzyme